MACAAAVELCDARPAITRPEGNHVVRSILIESRAKRRLKSFRRSVLSASRRARRRLMTAPNPPAPPADPPTDPTAGDPDPNDPKVKALIDAAVTTATTGLETNKNALLGEKKKLQEEFDAFKKQWDNIGDPEVIRGLVEKVATDEDAKLIAEGKMDEVIQRRTEALRKDLQTQVEAGATRIGELEEQLKQRDQRVKELVVDGRVRDAALGLKVEGPAVEDAIMHARMVFGLSETGDPEARDAGGSLLMSKDGTTPLQPAEWLEGMRATKPHWFGASSGGGSGGGTGERRTGDEAEKMSSRQKLEAGLTQGRLQ